MRNGWIAAAALCMAPAAAAQDMGPAPVTKEAEAPRHENRITPAAKAAFEKFTALLYSPLKGGLKDLSGAVKMEADMGAAGEEAKGRMGAMANMDLTFAVVFKAPADLKVEMKDAPGKGEAEKAGGEMGARMMKGMGERMSLAVSRVLRSTIEGFVPASDSEFDADVKVENGVSTVLITTYLKGVETSRQELTLDSNGIPSVMVSTPKAAEASTEPAPGGRGRGMRGADGKSTVKFTYAKEGELFRLEKMSTDGGQGPAEFKLDYADAGNFKVVKSWELAPAGAPFKFAFRFSEMVVNGKPVALDGAKPEPKPEPKPADPKGGSKGE